VENNNNMLLKKILYIDVETTGLEPDFHDIIELAYIIEINGEIKEKKCLKMQPFFYDHIDLEALQISKHTVEELKTFMTPQEAYNIFICDLGKFCDKFNKYDKFIPAGYNCRFDLEFLKYFFLKNGDKYFGSWQNWRGLDPLPILHFLCALDKISLSSMSLEKVCEFFKINIIAHSAESDIFATRELLQKIISVFKDIDISFMIKKGD